MSLANKTDVYQSQMARADRKSEDRGFILALACIVLFLVLASLIFPPVTSGNGHAVWLIGP